MIPVNEACVRLPVLEHVAPQQCLEALGLAGEGAAVDFQRGEDRVALPLRKVVQVLHTRHDTIGEERVREEGRLTSSVG